MVLFRELLNDIQHHIDSDCDMGVPRLKQLWNDLSYAITAHEENNRTCLVDLEPVKVIYTYFIAFNYGDGVGNTVLSFDHKIDSLKALRLVEKHIEQLNKNITMLNITNFILLETEPK